MQKEYDVIIVGAGIVGLTFAHLLAQNSRLSILVLETKQIKNDWSHDKYSPRVSAITLASQMIFESINIWDDLKTKRIAPFNEINVWTEALTSKLVFDSLEIAERELGFIIENNLMVDILIKKLKKMELLTYQDGINLKDLKYTNEGISLTSENGNCYFTRLLIGADGHNSWVRDKANIQIDRHQYEESAIVTTVKTELPHSCIARQVFLKDGPLAFLPLLESHLSSIVWSKPRDQAEELLALNDDQFKTELGNAFSFTLGNIEHIERRFSFPLLRLSTHHYIKPHLALLGDAAHVVHPLAGQGVNLGLQDARTLAALISDANFTNKTYYDHGLLRRYERDRKSNNLTMMIGIDAIKYVFSRQNKYLKSLNKLSIDWLNKTNWLKKMFIRQAVYHEFY